MPTTLDNAALAAMPLCADLSESELARVRALVRDMQVPAGTHLMLTDQPGEAAYVLVSGTVKVYVEQADGRLVILAILGPGDLVGELSLLESVGRTATVEALEPCTLLWMDRVAFWELMRAVPQICINLVRILARRLRLSSAHVQALAALDVHGRVASQVLAFAQDYGVAAPDGAVAVPLRLTQSDLADMVGASRARVNQTLGLLRDRAILSFDQNGHITIRDMSALAAYCQ